MQSNILRKYMATVPQPGRSLLVISYLGVWTKARPRSYDPPAPFLKLGKPQIPDAVDGGPRTASSHGTTPGTGLEHVFWF